MNAKSIPDESHRVPSAKSGATGIEDAIQVSLSRVTARLGRLDPLERIITANKAIEALRDAQGDLAGVRRAAVRQLRAEGWLLKEIAQQLGTSPQRVHQMEEGYDRHEKKARAEG